MQTSPMDPRNRAGVTAPAPAEAGNEFGTDDRRWDALVRRDRHAEGMFVYGVQTTGIYCRPGCASRLPKRENVHFFPHWQEAERAGFRPCKRCRPEEPRAAEPYLEAIVQACQRIKAAVQQSEPTPSLKELAEAAGFSPFHFQRLFKKTVGVSPKQYAVQTRLNQVRADLQDRVPVTESLYDAGFASSSRFYENVTASLGMKPSEVRNGARHTQIRFAIRPSYLGRVLIAATKEGICAIEFGDTTEVLRERLRTRFPQAELWEGDPVFDAVVAQVLEFLGTPRRGLDLPLDIQGTAFQRRVWSALQEVPAGSTASYAQIAARLGRPRAARAVAGACAANRLAAAIPCHRAVRSDGALGGYRWGVERKRALLERENEDLQQQHRIAEGEETVL